MRQAAISPRQVSSASAASRDTVIVQHREIRAEHRKSLANYYAPEHAAENTDEHVSRWAWTSLFRWLSFRTRPIGHDSHQNQSQHPG